MLLENATNRDKGFSLPRGIQAATGGIVLIQHADLEYDPQDYSRLLDPILRHKADAVYGSRFIYHGRCDEEGKKVGWRDGLRALLGDRAVLRSDG